MAAMESTSALKTFDIELSPDDGSGGFHTKNNPLQPFQRQRIHQTRGAVNIKCSLLDVAHGKWAPESNEFASLVVLEFRFDAGKPGRRIISSAITVTFAGQSISDIYPGVENLSFNDSCRLGVTTEEETITTGIGGNLGVSVLNSAQISADRKYERVVSHQNVDAACVTGSACAIGVDWGPDNAVEWKLRENKMQGNGVPVYFRAGILLKRETLANFQCMVAIDSTVDALTKIEGWFGRKYVDDPVLFNPNFRATERLMEYDLENLSGTDLVRVGEVRFATVLD